MSFRIQDHIRKVYGLVAATLIVPAIVALAYSGTDNGKSNDGQNDGQQKGRIETVPDGGPGIALMITTFGAILLFSVRQSSRKKAEKNGC